MSTIVRHPVVQIRSGAVRGSVSDGVYVFKGIPYAAAPFGAHRLLPPQPLAPWSGVRDAVAFGPTPPKPAISAQILAILPEQAIPGEECLNLNVWSPELGTASRPVMVWLPGGMFEYGTAATAWYDGSRFARDGVVCVTINYRVGAEGFLYLGDDNANRGLLDQVAALHWVRENIAAFGGDPANVTIFGESAGAMSVGTLLAMPAAAGLFRRAIAQSGAAQHVMSVATAEQIRQELAARLGVPATRAGFAGVPLDHMLAAQAELKEDLVAHPDPLRWGVEAISAMLPWQPVVDGATIPAAPLDRVRAGDAAAVDLMVGSNTDEHRLFLVLSGALDQVTDGALEAAVAGYSLPVETTLTAYRAAHPGASAGDLFAALQGDWYWRIPAIRLADAHARTSPATYMYEFAWRSPQFNGLLGACHSLEIAFVFDTLGNQTGGLLGAEPPQRLADAMHAAWVAFATNGDPGWPRYDVTRRATMRFDATMTVVNDPLVLERGVWEGVR